jgi:hypothetical protein
VSTRGFTHDRDGRTTAVTPNVKSAPRQRDWYDSR